MREHTGKTARVVGLIIAMVLLVNIFYVPEVSAVEPYTLMTIFPELTTSDGRVSVILNLTYQESYGVFVAASIKSIGGTSDVFNLVVENPVISSDGTIVRVQVGYNYTSWFSTYYVVETLSKSVP